ncbi:MAG: zinc transporter ZntB [Desulfobulbaceae bacterium]|nr:zinc transporter ZntB [Desulfobulbaceae bacterium]HIJ77921.1 zinc transporter ZntB [Deltaproteobacteria bacterium]
MDGRALLHAYLIDGSGGAKSLNREEVFRWQQEDGLLWLHFDYTAPETAQWIINDEQIDEISRESLLSEETRPRTTTINNTLLLALRGVNLNPGADPEDMIAIRLWADQHRIVTTVKRNLLSIADLIDFFKQGVGPTNSAEFICGLADRLTHRMNQTIENIEDRLADMEEKVLAVGTAQLRQELSSIRRDSIVLRRYLAPQREAMIRLSAEKISWLGETERFRLKETTDQLIRYIEDLDSIKDRATILHEELVSNLSEQMNNRMYVLSLAAAVFLPLGFLTGLFGINVGGIPGSESKMAFPLFVALLFGLAIVLIILFKNKKWL